MSERLRIGLLQAGYVHPDVAAVHGDYPALFADLLDPFGIDLVTYDLQRTGRPTDLDGRDRHDGWIISGSASSAYEDEPWIRDLEDLGRTLLDRQAPVVGICFGHQVLAQAAGGRVAKAEAGWGVGVHEYRLTGGRPSWIGGDDPGPFRMIASHQDQVVELPDGAVPFLTSDLCPNAGFTLGDDAFTIQPHPEFTTGISAGLLALRRDAIGAERADEASATLDGAIDQVAVAGWIDAFFRERA